MDNLIDPWIWLSHLTKRGNAGWCNCTHWCKCTQRVMPHRPESHN
jgi:hypothetical protein